MRFTDDFIGERTALMIGNDLIQVTPALLAGSHASGIMFYADGRKWDKTKDWEFYGYTLERDRVPQIVISDKIVECKETLKVFREGAT